MVRTPPHPDYLVTARRHLERIQAAWYELTDWDDLTLYGFYCHLLISLNRARKAVAYGDTPLPELDAERVAQAIEEYVTAAARFIGERDAT